MTHLEPVVSTGERCSPLGDHFPVEFQERMLRSAEDLRKSFRLRYEVYCEEQGFLPTGDYPEGIETDAYDDRSLHFGSFNGKDDVVGTVRLVHGTGLHEMPMWDHCSLYPEQETRFHKISNLVEVSRLAVSKQYRRRANDGQYGLDSSGLEKRDPMDRRRTTFPTVLRLYRVMYHALKQQGIEHVVASMEVSLYRILRALRFPFHEIGPEADYYGPVRPFYLHLPELDHQLAWSRPQLLQYFNEGLDTKYQALPIGALSIVPSVTKVDEIRPTLYSPPVP